MIRFNRFNGLSGVQNYDAIGTVKTVENRFEGLNHRAKAAVRIREGATNLLWFPLPTKAGRINSLMSRVLGQCTCRTIPDWLSLLRVASLAQLDHAVGVATRASESALLLL